MLIGKIWETDTNAAFLSSRIHNLPLKSRNRCRGLYWLNVSFKVSYSTRQRILPGTNDDERDEVEDEEYED